MREHLVIPDCQVKPGVPTDHLDWIGQYILDKKPDVIVNIGDFADMPSLSSYDAGKKSAEGRRIRQDLDAAYRAMERLVGPMKRYNAKRKQFKEKQYRPEMHLTMGNHEHRITRAIESDAKLEGLLEIQELQYEKFGWKVHPFQEAVEIDGIWYSHYFYNPMTGRPYGGENIKTRLKNIGFSFTMGHQQGYDSGVRHLNNGKTLRGLIAGSCLTPDHKVLTADLEYVPLGDLKPGDKLISFDENPEETRKRRYKTGTVEKVRRDYADCFAVTLDNGKVFKVTEDHVWLTRVGGQTSQNNGGSYMWRPTDRFRRGTLVPMVFDEWQLQTSRDAGYLAGMYDGEGSLYGRKTSAPGGSVMQLNVSQKVGPVLDECMRIIQDMFGFDCMTDTRQDDVAALRIKGGARNCAKVLGSVRPIRLLNKFCPEWLGSMSTAKNSKVVDIKHIGRQEIVRIAIDEKTMIVEGYPHHNCYLHDEDYIGPQGNGHWRGIVYKHEVFDGNYDLMEVSLDFLCRKYNDLEPGLRLWQYMKIKYPELYQYSPWLQWLAKRYAALSEAKSA